MTRIFSSVCCLPRPLSGSWLPPRLRTRSIRARSSANASRSSPGPSSGCPWRTIPLNFNTFHPQGMVKIGDTFYLSAVDIRKPTTRYPQLQDGYDRDTGEGVGHLFKFDAKGNLIADLTLGEGSIYHPGGIDYDGKWIWVPAAEYRPNSRAIMYQRRSDDDEGDRSFALRRSHRRLGLQRRGQDAARRKLGLAPLLPLDARQRRQGKQCRNAPGGAARDATLRTTSTTRTANTSVVRKRLCSGLNMYQSKKDGPRFALGGFEIVDLAANHAIYQVPVELWTDSGLPMTYNPFWIEPTANGLRAYFVPEDEKSTLYVFEAEVK